MQLVMSRVNEDGLWRIGSVGGIKKKVGGFLREGDIETVRANELDLLETWHSAHGTLLSLSSVEELARASFLSEP